MVLSIAIKAIINYRREQNSDDNSYLLVDNPDKESFLLAVLCDDCEILLTTSSRLAVNAQFTVSSTNHLQQHIVIKVMRSLCMQP